MPRQGRSSGAGRAPSRPTIPAKKPVSQQTRTASSVAQPPAQNAIPPQQSSSGPGLFGQMASTAAAVTVGSSIGHAIGGLFSGGTSQPLVESQNDSTSNKKSADQQNNWGATNCEFDAKQFTKCMDENRGNMQICNWYLEQLKTCQQTASQY